MQISVLIPTLNEARTIGPTLQRLHELKPPVEVVVVDGYSSLPGSPLLAFKDPTEGVTVFLLRVGKWSDGSAGPPIQ